jgi:hypothetical protein
VYLAAARLIIEQHDRLITVLAAPVCPHIEHAGGVNEDEAVKALLKNGLRHHLQCSRLPNVGALGLTRPECIFCDLAQPVRQTSHI